MKARFLLAAVLVATPLSLPAQEPGEDNFAYLETRLRPLTEKPRNDDWRSRHPEEKGQTFAQYLRDVSVRRSKKLTTIYLCLLGDFTREQTKILDATSEYLSVVFDAPVKIRKRLPLDKVPGSARREHPTWKGPQVLSTYLLNEVLKPDRPDDALAYLCFTASDLWPGEGWNFVFGQASLNERVGVWSIHRNGDPSAGEEAYAQCLRRTLATAAHETGHILTLQHCTAFACNLNGSNSLAEADTAPLSLCPVCLRKVCWNLQVGPAKYLKKQRAFCDKHGLKKEAEWYGRAIRLLE